MTISTDEMCIRDRFCTLLSWHRAQELVRLVSVCTLRRGNTDADRELEQAAQAIQAAGGSTQFIDARPLALSSTQVRRQLAEGCRSSKELGIAEPVLHYIWQNSLYGVKKEEYPWPEQEYLQMARQMEHTERFEHSVQVARRAQELARRYGQDETLARLAGILHDLCKNLPEQEQLKWVYRLHGLSKSAIIKDKILPQVPPVWHGPAAAAYLFEQLGVYNRELLSAVAYHTTGRADMSVFEKVVYLADLTSAERTYPDAVQMRALADRDLDAAMRESLLFTAEKMRRNATPATQDTLEIMKQYGVPLGR